MRSSLFAFATDFSDEGVDVALGRIQDRAGVQGVSLAAVYHHGRDIFPHSPTRRVRFLEGGAAFFQSDPSRYAEHALRPRQSALAEDFDAVAELRKATAARGMDLHAWTVLAHNTRLASEEPDTAVENVYGDPQLTYLCPANPRVVAYASGLAGDLARYGVDTLLAESLHFHPFEHGYHHERYLIDIGPIDRFLLGLCFCAHCRAAGRSEGVDVDALTVGVRARLDALFESAAAYDPTPATFDVVHELWGGELGGYLRARERSVTTAAAAVVDALDGTGTRFAFMDQAGAIKGYADGVPTGGPAPETSWEIGVNSSELGAICDEFQLLAYAKDPGRTARDIAAYRESVGSTCRLRAAFRPIPPDCIDADNLRTKLDAADAGGVAYADLYHYGFARLETLDLISAAR